MEDERQTSLVGSVLDSDLTTKQRAAVEKDCLLVSAAWTANDLVASNDDKVRALVTAHGSLA
jgi:hypothetical protein